MTLRNITCAVTFMPAYPFGTGCRKDGGTTL